MSQQELLRLVVRSLDDLDVEYMLTGSIVSSLQGEPRSTHDIDLVVAIEPASFVSQRRISGGEMTGGFYGLRSRVGTANSRRAI